MNACFNSSVREPRRPKDRTDVEENVLRGVDLVDGVSESTAGSSGAKLT